MIIKNLKPFNLSPHKVHLKVCGVTTKQDALKLIQHHVSALGFNFWEKSKRYIQPDKASQFSPQLKGQILRVGVFVNASHQHILSLLQNDIIDVAQLHGDEDVNFCKTLADHNAPFIKAIGVENAKSLENISNYQANAILLDAHAPVVYGGTGNTFDWNLTKKVIQENPQLPIILAGGITKDNAEDAAQQVAPLILDVASGAESTAGIKDFDKISAILSAINN